MSSLRDLADELRFVLQLEDEDPKVAAQRAAAFAQKAAKKGDRNAIAYWKGVYAHAQSRLRTAAGHPDGPPSHGHDHGQAAAPAEPAKKLSFKDKLRAAAMGVKGAVKTAAAGAVDKLKNAPLAVHKLVADPKFRATVGRKAAAAIKKGAAKAILHACAEVAEVVKAGAVVGKAASGKKLTAEDKHILKAGAKALASTIAGTIAFGGLAHLTAGALAQHFAIETVAKSVGKAAMYAGLATEAEKSAMLQHWAEIIAEGIQKGFAGLGDMDPDKLADILSTVHGDSGDEDEDDDEEQS